MADERQMLIEHRQTWKGFMTLVKWSCIAIALVMLGLFWFVY